MFNRTCVICGADFTANGSRALYCAKCRKEVDRRQSKKRYKEKAIYTPKGFYIYSCALCKRTIKVIGRSNSRKYCDECLTVLGPLGVKLLTQRKELPEVIVGAGD